MKAHELIRLHDRFERGDWNFQVNYEGDETIHKIDEVRFIPDPQNKISYRIRKAFMWLFTGGGSNFRRLMSGSDGFILWRFRMFFHALKRDKNSPDGYLNDGSIVTFWCEDGMYIELFQPSVGQLIADFLEKSPNNPHAKKIAQEIERIGNREDGHLQEMHKEEL